MLKEYIMNVIFKSSNVLHDWHKICSSEIEICDWFITKQTIAYGTPRCEMRIYIQEMVCIYLENLSLANWSADDVSL